LYNFYVSDRKIIRVFVVARKRKQAFSSLAPRSLVNLSIDVICLRTTIQYQVKSTLLSILKLTVRFFYPRVLYSCFLYYFCLCKSFKEHFLSARSQERFLFSGCKGTTFPETNKTFQEKNSNLKGIFYTS